MGIFTHDSSPLKWGYRNHILLCTTFHDTHKGVYSGSKRGISVLRRYERALIFAFPLTSICTYVENRLNWGRGEGGGQATEESIHNVAAVRTSVACCEIAWGMYLVILLEIR